MALVRGMLIRQFANVFQLRQMGHVGDSLWAAHKADISAFFRSKPNERRWEALKKYYDSDFRNFVDREILELFTQDTQIGLLFHNVDHIKEDELEALSQNASSTFFLASARFLDMLSYVEKLGVCASSGLWKDLRG